MKTRLFSFRRCAIVMAGLLCLAGLSARGEAMLELFQMSWSDLTKKMPEIAEAGYTSLWLPPPSKGTSVYSVGYDQFDPFDLGDKNQRGTIATKYGTKAQLLQMVQTAHQFGIRVYFDNVMNHRAFDVPGYNSSTPTNLYPGLLPQDFHLQTVSGGYYRNWPSVQDWNNQWDVQYESLGGLVDLANEPGSINGNFGPTLGSTIPKISFVRHPNNPEYYLDPNGPSLGGAWHPLYTTGGVVLADDVNSYLIRAAMWTLYVTRCDGFRLDAVKHVPSGFFGNGSQVWDGYTGAIQAMFDWVHGYGTNFNSSHVETDDCRNSCFDTEIPRNDAMLFGEHAGTPPSYGEYITGGMRLLNVPMRGTLDSALSGGSLSGLDQRDIGSFQANQGVQFAQDQDHMYCCVSHRELHDAYNFMHEGLPMIYSDSYNFAGSPNNSQTFPIVPYANYLGQFADNQMPDVCYLHNQLARGGTRPRWSDQNIVAWERYDYRDVSGSDPFDNPDATVVFFAMNDNYSNPGDILFDDGINRTGDGYYSCHEANTPSRGYAMRIGFPPGSVLSQLASSSPGANRACAKLLVHSAATNRNDALASAAAPYAPDRLLWVNTTPPPGGGAIELVIPSGGWVMYGYQWPEPSRANALTNAIIFRQGGLQAPSVTVYRQDGPNGDSSFSPLYPFKMRGSVDANGNVVTATGEGNVSNRTYAINVPLLTNAPFDILLRCDASATNILARLDGGLDLNSQMGFAPTSGFDLRDNRPGYATDVFLGYEQAAPQFRNGPEKFAARDISRDTVVSAGAETYYYTNGGGLMVVNGSGGGLAVKTQTADWVYHDPVAPVTVVTNAAVPVAPATQMDPTNPVPGQDVNVWVKDGDKSQIDTCYLYYTTDGTNPEGAFGVGKGTTRAIQGGWINADSQNPNIDWWKATIPGSNQVNGVHILYKIALYHQNVPAISDADSPKLYGLTQFGITNFNPTTARVWLHNDLNTNSTSTGLATGLHIVRSRCFLPRNGKSGVYNTFLQTFYYDGQLPSGVVAYPAADGNSISNASFTVVVRADGNVTQVGYTITDSFGSTNGFATAVTPDSTLSQQYTNYPQEFRFTYNPVPTSGSATINVTLQTLSTSILPSRYTTLTRTVNTFAPGSSVQIVNPAIDGSVLVLPTNTTSYLLQACLTTNLATDSSLYSLYINGVLQPRANYIIRGVGSVGGCPGKRSFLYYWPGPVSGTNVIQLLYTNTLTLSDTRVVAVALLGDPTDSDGDGAPNWMEVLAGTNPYDATSFLHITSLAPGNPVVVSWSSVPDKVYQVLATTNLLAPMVALPNALVPADPSANITYWPDPAPDATNRFYRIQLVQ